MDKISDKVSVECVYGCKESVAQSKVVVQGGVGDGVLVC